MRILRALLDWVRDTRSIGASFATHRLRQRAGGPLVRTSVRGAGRVVLRPGTSDAVVFAEIFRDRQYDLQWFPQQLTLRARYDDLLARGRRPLIIDAGANNGASALWFAGEYPMATIVAIEPERSNAEICRLNTRTKRVEVIDAAVGGEGGSVRLESDGTEMWSVVTERDAHGSVPIVTINDIVDARRDRCELFLVKIDIEGFEADLFGSNVDWLNEAAGIFIEPHDRKFPGEAVSAPFRAALSGPEFDLLISGENLVFVRTSPHPSGPSEISDDVNRSAASPTSTGPRSNAR